MKYTKKKKSGPKIIKEKFEQKVKVRKDLGKDKLSKDIQALVRTWDEDLCE